MTEIPTQQAQTQTEATDQDFFKRLSDNVSTVNDWFLLDDCTPAKLDEVRRAVSNIDQLFGDDPQYLQPKRVIVRMRTDLRREIPTSELLWAHWEEFTRLFRRPPSEQD